MIAKPAAMPGTCGASSARPPESSVNSASGHRRFRRIAPACSCGSELLVRAPASRRAIAGLACSWRPRRRPVATESSHQPKTTRSSCVPERKPAARTVTSASALAAPALSITVVRRKSTKRTLLQQRLEQFAHAAGARDREVGLLGETGRGFVGGDRHAQRAGELAGVHERAQAAERIQVGAVVAYVQRRGQIRAAQQRGDPESLAERHRRAYLEHLAPPVHGEALLLRLACELAHRLLGEALVGGAAPVEGRDRGLVLAAHAHALQLGGVYARGELAN